MSRCTSGKWEAYTSVYNITWISNPTEDPTHGGLFGRCIGVSKYAMAAAKKGDPNCPRGEAATAACVGGYLFPLLESGYSPSSILLGRKDLMAHVIEREFLPEGRGDTDPYVSMHESGVKRILGARTAVSEYESKEAVTKRLAKQLRAYADQYFAKDQNVQVMMNGRWQGGFRFIGTQHRNGLAEKGPTVTRVPLSFVIPSP